MRFEDDIAVSFMTVGELIYGAYCSSRCNQNTSLVDEFLSTVLIVNTDIKIMKTFGLIKSALKRDGVMLPDADIMIASSAMEKCDFLVSGNLKHFKRIDGLKCYSWSDTVL